MVNATKKNRSPLPLGRYGKLTKHSIRRRHQVNKGKSGLEAEGVRALGALHSLRSKMRLSAEKRRKTHSLCNEKKDKRIEDDVDRETTVARKRVQDAETAIMEE